MNINSGIYKIANGMNPLEYYLGSAVKFSTRFPRHRSDLKNHKHHNRHLQELYDKYGLDNLIFEIIEYVDNKEDLIVREQYYIDTLKPKYNVCQIAGNTLGRKFSEETLHKMSESKKGNKNYMYGKHPSEETKLKLGESKSKPFKLLSPQGQVFEGINLRKFCRENNLHRNCIYAVINNKQKSYKGWTTPNSIL